MDSPLVLQLALMYPTAVEGPDLPSLTGTSDHEREAMPKDPEDTLPSFDNGIVSQWHIDGVAEGTRYFAVPDFARGQPPLRIDVYAPELAQRSHPLWHSAHLNAAFDASSSQIASSIAGLIVVHILNRWSNKYAGFEDAYRDLPYGSYIVLGNIHSDLSLATVDMIPNFAVERAWMPIDSLINLWDLPKTSWPETIGWDQLQLERQIHESIALVRIPSSTELLVYKSVLHDLQHFYHEVKILLRLSPHPNVLAKPRYIVTMKTRFGSKIGVCGVLLEYHNGGTLQEALSKQKKDGPWTREQLRKDFSWARQIVSGSIHVRESVGFYANMKLINIVMSPDQNNLRPVLVDFEQRSGWFSWSPPEVHYIGYVEHLASYSDNATTRAHCTSLLRKLLPDWKPTSIRARYGNPKDGYATAWLDMNDTERESAQVYMLGKLLWCIFEHSPTISSCITLETFREPPCNLVFPNFSRTPKVLRTLIQRCTFGAPGWYSRWPPVYRIGRRLHKINYEQSGTRPIEAELVDIQRACKEWWTGEIERAELYIEARARHKNGEPEKQSDTSILSYSAQRPKLSDVAKALEAMERDSSWLIS